MRKLLTLVLATTVFVVACERQYEANPDPNHTHADFAVWIEGEQVDFSQPEFMSGAPVDEHADEDEAEEHKHLHQYLHLHDENGHVIHRHKPGLTLREFFESLGIVFSKEGLHICMDVPDYGRACEDEAAHRNWVMIINGEKQLFFNPEYVFSDMDKILIVLPETDGGEEQLEAWGYWEQMTDEACLYSQTCPWKGEPPTENCVADPAVPCVVPEEDL